MSTITPAASVLVARAPNSLETYLVWRSPALRFMGGMVAFPGGKVHSDDDLLARPMAGLTSRHVAAIRELFEETGILLVHGMDGQAPRASADLDRLRKLLLADQITFGQILEAGGWHLDPTDLTGAGSLVTPPFAPLRFDTAFFTATLPEGQEATIWPGELVEGRWASAEAAFAEWRQGRMLLTPPTISILDAIRGRPVAELAERLRPTIDRLDAGGMPTIWFQAGVQMIPLDCQGLPPTTHTNAFLVGSGPTYLIDPGPPDPHEQEKLFEILDQRQFDAIVLTHHHPDHIGAVNVTVQRYGVPVFAHRVTADRLAGKVKVDRFLDEGERLDMGEAPHGCGRWALEALFTPGHAPGHLAFYERDYQLLFTGDMVSTLSSMIVSPEDGDLTLYVASLRRLKSYPTRLLLPAHGAPTTKAATILEEAINHREQRRKQLIESLARGSRSVEELALELYRGFPESVLELARIQIRAGLIQLEREGRAARVGERWQGR